MSYRNSFSNCVDAMGKLFAQNRYKLLHIMHNPQGKYYTLYTPEELENKLLQITRNAISNSELHNTKDNVEQSILGDDGDRLVLSITQKELRILHERRQEDLFTKPNTKHTYDSEN